MNTVFSIYKFLCYNVFVIFTNVVYAYLIMSYTYIANGNVVFGEGSQNTSNMEYYYQDMFNWSEVFFLIHLVITAAILLSPIVCGTVKFFSGSCDQTFSICFRSIIVMILLAQVVFFTLAINTQQYVSVTCGGVIENPKSSRPNTFDMCYFYNNYFKIMFNVLAAEVAVILFHILTFQLFVFYGFIMTTHTGKIIKLGSDLSSDPGSRYSDPGSRYSNSVSRYRSSLDSQFTV